jgi:hypothetical protein
MNADPEQVLDLADEINGSRPGRSILLTKLKIGMRRSLQTVNNFLVCASTPFAQSRASRRVDGAMRWCPHESA